MTNMTDISVSSPQSALNWLKFRLAPYRFIAFFTLGLWLTGQLLHLTVPGLPQKIMTDLVERKQAVLTLFLLTAIIARILYRALTDKPESPLRALCEDVTDRDRLLNILVTLGIYFIFMAFFVELKSAMPMIVPFQWDASFARADLWLHGGYYPHEWLSFLLETPMLLSFINILYHLWFFIMWAGLFFAAVQKHHSPLRGQFLNSFFAVWIIAGLITAYGFSSAGPVYFSNLGLSPDPYAAFIERLHNINDHYYLPALEIQKLLWQANQLGEVAGISAFPSMHNAICAILTLAAFRLHRALGWFMLAFSFFIGIGSVILGWHYAVDAYAGWALGFLTWKLAAGRKVQLP